MTCIAGIAQNGRVWLGGDSAGFTDSFRMGQLLAHAFVPPRPRQGADLGGDFQVYEPLHGYHAVGCGHDLARGSLHATQRLTDPVQRLELALEAAEAFSVGVRGPFCVISAGGPT